jgi:hypothetical protein
MNPRRALFAFLLVLIAPFASGQLITFDQTPAGGVPADDSILNTTYSLTVGGTVRFFFDIDNDNAYTAGTDHPPLFEAAGADGIDGFANQLTGIADTANGGFGAQLGSHFLRPFNPGLVPKPLIIDYDTPETITGLSGEIWDIDGSPLETEWWRVDVLDAAGGVLATQLSPLGNSAALDSQPWQFLFTGLPSGVDKVRILFTGTKQGGVGLAFNNFNPLIAVPEPTSMALGLLAGVWGIGWVVRSRWSGRA